MPAQLALSIIDFLATANKELYKATLNAVAESRKVRAAFLLRKSKTMRHQDMLVSLGKPTMEMIAGDIIRTWLLESQTEMLTDFLDKLGIEHQKGGVDEFPDSVDPMKLNEAIDLLLSKYPPESVTVYLHSIHGANEAQWSELGEALDKDPRLQLV